MEYCTVKIFTKRTNMRAWFLANVCPTLRPEHYAQMERHYDKERDVRLILLVRYEREPLKNTMRTICKIHCPVNPLPVKGEFEVPTFGVIKRYLNDNGWTEREHIPANLLK